MRARFGDCVLDTQTRQLTRKGVAIAIEPKAFELLRVLLEKRPQALSKDELDEVLWPQAFVSDSSLARLVSGLRTAIGDDARNPRFLRTLHGFGYAFSGDAVEIQASNEEPGAGSRCWLVRGKQVIPLAEGENLLGRATDSLLVVDSRQVSRRHTRIVISARGAMLEDLGSKNGTYVEGKKVQSPVELIDGDHVAIGPVVVVYRRSDQSETTVTELSKRHGETTPGDPPFERNPDDDTAS